MVKKSKNREKIGKGNPPKHTRFKKGEVSNPNGRPRKFVTTLKINGYKMSEINDTIQSMLSMTIEELKTVFENKDATIMEKTVANALKKSLEKGNLDSIETLLNRVYGRPKEKIEIKNEQVEKLYKELIDLSGV